MSIPPGTDTEKSSMGGGVHLLNGIAHYQPDPRGSLKLRVEIN